MAIVKFGAIVTDIKGKLGGHVFQGSKGGSSLRTKPGKTKVGRVTLRQWNPTGISPRAVFQDIASNWQKLDPDTKLAWDSLLGVWTFTNKFGDTVNRTGYSIYTAANVNRALAGLAPLDYPPLEDAPYSLEAAIDYDPLTEDFTFTVNNAEAVGQIFVIEQAPIVSKAKLAPSQKYSIIYTGTVAGTSPISIEPYVKFPPNFDFVNDDYAMFFRVWTFKASYPKKYGVQELNIRQGL